MNVTDPLENHRKNLHNFYLACNIFSKAEKSSASHGQNDNQDDVNATSSFLPFFHFVDTDTSTSKSIKKLHDNENFVRSDIQNHDNVMDENSSTLEATKCDAFSQIKMDMNTDEKPYSKEDCRSDSKSDHEVDLSHSELLVSATEKPFSDLFGEAEIKREFITTCEKNGNEMAKYNGRNDDDSNEFYDRNSSSLANFSISIDLQDTKSDGHPTSCRVETIIFSCEHCAKTFHHKSSLSRHIAKCPNRLQANDERKCSNEIRPKKWTKSAIVEKTCKICGHIARKPCELKLHLSKHTGERPYLCKECGIGFSSTSKLNRHIRNKVHAKGKFYCELCKVYFTLKANYERHKLEHSLPLIKKKPFACSICDKRFNRVDILRKHEDVHSRESRELFECITCGRKFSRKDTLSRHISRQKCVDKS